MNNTTSRRLLAAAAGLACLLLPSTLAAQEVETTSSDSAGAFTVGLTAGYQQRDRASDSAGTTTFKSGYLLDTSFGYREQGHHVEAAFTYFYNGCKTTDPAGDFIGVEPSSGNVDGKAFMGNYSYNFGVGVDGLELYVGAGIGRYRVSINGLTTPSLRALPAEYGGPIIVYAKSSWTTAYQLRAGAKFELTKGLDLLAGYRMFDGSTMNIRLADGSIINPDCRFHAFEASLRYSW